MSGLDFNSNRLSLLGQNQTKQKTNDHLARGQRQSQKTGAHEKYYENGIDFFSYTIQFVNNTDVFFLFFFFFVHFVQVALTLSKC